MIAFRHFRFLFCTLGAVVLFPWSTSPTLAQSDEISFKHLTTENGLSESGVRRIWQDRHGFMWFCTGDGLNRFDGYSFKVFRHNPTDPSSLSSNNVSVIYEDRSGALWIGTDGGGLNLYDAETESFTREQYDPQDPGVLSANVHSICQDRSGVMWIGTNNGLIAFDRRAGSFTQYRHDLHHPTSLSNDDVWSICEDKSGALWVGTFGGGLNRLDPRTGFFIQYQNHPQDPGSLSNNSVFSIYQDGSGAVWVGTSNGLNLFDSQRGAFTRYRNDPRNPRSLSGRTVLAVYEDRAGTLWIATDNGLSSLDRERKYFVNYRNDPRDPDSLVNNYVTSLYEDHGGVLWVGTFGGLNLFDRWRKSFTHWRSDPENPNSLSHNNVWSIREDRFGVLWVGTFGGGLNLLDQQRSSFVHYKNNPQDLTSLSNDVVTAIYEDHSGAPWVGTYNRGLNLFDRKTRSFICYQHDLQDPTSLSNSRVMSIFEDRSGALWVGTNNGLNRFERQSTTFTSYRHDPKNPRTLSSSKITSILEDRSGALWIGTYGGGLNLFDRRGETFTRYQHSPGDVHSLSNNVVYSIHEDRTGALWIGTSGGLDLFDPASGVSKRYQEKDGLPNNVVYGILEDSSNRLWLSTNKGISRFNPNTGEFRNYDASDGLGSSEFNNGAFWETHDGTMYFGGTEGLTGFHPDSIRDNPFIPPVVITDLLLFNKPVQVGADYEGFVLPQSVTTAEELVLSYRETVFTLEFSALCYVNPERQKYAYRLEGFDKGWVSTDAKRRFATYTNLDPGTYVFRVKGSNHDGIWNEEGRSLRIVITPPWWKTRWAYLGYALVIVGALFTIRRSEKSRDSLKHQAELEHARAESLQEVDSMKSHFFANISHEFRTPLTLILGPIQKWREKAHEAEEEKDLGMAERNAHRLLRLINQLLDLSKLEAGGMKLQAARGKIVPFVKGIAQSFQSSAGRRNVELVVEAERDGIEVYFDRDKMEKILTNLMSNAFKFTSKGGRVNVSVRLRRDVQLNVPAKADCVEITVTDTGIGIPSDQLDKVFDRFYQVDASQTREHEGSGIGLALTKELVELHHGTISVKSEVGKGTEFTVTLLLGREHLKDEEIVEADELRSLSESLRAIPTGRESEAISPSLPQPVEAETEESVARSDARPFVLIVEDNADVRAYMRDYLVAGYDVQEAHDGAEGIEKALETIPDLIISDVMMPKKDGYELCKTLKLDEKTSHIPIILLTAKAGTDNRIEGLETGADDYLTKPFDAKELLVRVKNLIDVRRKLRARFSVGQALRPGEIAVTSIDDAFLQKVKTVVEENMGKETFSVDDLGSEVAMSRSQLYRKLSALTGQSPSDFIRYMRLHRAMDLLKQNAGTVSEIAYAVGFNSVTYFTKCFREQFDVLPSEVRKQQQSP